MQLLNIDKLKKYYNDRLVLDIDKFEILEDEKIGLVGTNGAGKTTLIKALIGKIEIDEGQIYLTDSYSYITQNENLDIESGNSKIKSMLNAPDKFEEHLSGGEKVKLKIATALKEQKKLVIADEPTSNLDQKSIYILEEMLKKHKGSLLLVSHDRDFLDALCNKIVEIEDGKIKIYNGNYTTYLKIKEEERNRQEFEYEQFVSEKNRLEAAKAQKMNLSNGIRKTPKRMGNSEARLHKMGGQKGKKSLDGNAKAIQSRIDKLEMKERPKSINLVEINDLTLSVNKEILLDNVSFKVKRNKKIALIGENGCGKTTLIKEIIKNNNPKVKINPRVRIGYFDQSQEILDNEKSILDNIKKDSSFDETFIRINLNLFGFKGDDVYKKVGILSGGEKVKVSLCKIILEDNNFLILDEPTNYLDIVSIKALEESLQNTDKTMLIVSHDRAFINTVCNDIIEIKNNKIEEFNGNYKQYIEHRNIKSSNKKNNEEILLLENKMSRIISMLSTESNENKKEEYEQEYKLTLAQLKALRDS